jgi:hypothetical protein
MRSFTSLLILPIGLALTTTAFAGERNTRADVRQPAPVRAAAPAAARYHAQAAHYAAQPRVIRREVVAPRRTAVQQREFVAPRRAAIQRQFVAPRRAAVRREFVAPRHTATIRREFVAPRHTATIRREFAAPRHTMTARQRFIAPRTRFVRISNTRFMAPARFERVATARAHRTALLRERVREMQFVRARHMSFVSGRVVRVRNNVVMIERPTGVLVPVSVQTVRYVPAFRTIAPGSIVTLPVIYGTSNVAVVPNFFSTASVFVPTVMSNFVPANFGSFSPFANNGFDGDADDVAPVAFNTPSAPDCTQPYYGDNFNQYYFTVQQYDEYCGYYYNNNVNDGFYSPNLASFGTPIGALNPYYSPANTALVSGIIVGRSGSNLIVLTNNFQPAIVNVSEAQAFGNTGGSLQVGQPIVAAGFYDPTNTLVATAIQ